MNKNLDIEFEVTHIEIGGDIIPTPVGLSELLEPFWSLEVDREKVNKIASKYDFVDYRNEHGRWVTKCIKRK